METCNDIFEHARRKLINSKISLESYLSSFEWSSLLAVADVRLCLEYDNQNITLVTETSANLVAHHMRLAYSIPKDRNWLHSGYSSEPILALVSVNCL